MAATAFGQSTATLQGTVTDQKGGVVPNATVTARNEATSVERSTQTDSDGNYAIASLPVGAYTIEVQAQGFKNGSRATLRGGSRPYNSKEFSTRSGDRVG